ncbi:MAG TPA: hypothetical protein VGO82_02460 [Enterovirga sp.]|jgi:hypothetical protein|nr:hypothetical protein [Enterovirga sp.]
MSEKPSTYVGLACAALVLAGFVPGISDAATGTSGRSSASIPVSGGVSGSKGDLLTARRPAARNEVSIIRIEGEHAAVSMRTRAGDLVYHADGATRLSVAAKNVVLPPAPDRMTSPAVAPVAIPEPASPTLKAEARKMPVGCERLVSVLVKSAERDRIGRCLA